MLIKSKIGRIICFIKNENKFKRSDFVEVSRNTNGRKIYDKYVGQYAIVTNTHFDKKENYTVGLKFLDGESLDFKPCELRKCDYIEEMQNKDYSKLLKMI